MSQKKEKSPSYEGDRFYLFYDPNGIVSQAEKAYCHETKLERILQSALTPSFDDAHEAITSLLICQCHEQNGYSDKNIQADQASY